MAGGSALDSLGETYSAPADKRGIRHSRPWLLEYPGISALTMTSHPLARRYVTHFQLLFRFEEVRGTLQEHTVFGDIGMCT